MAGTDGRMARKRALLITFVVMACITLFFAGRFTYSLIYWSNPAHQYQPIEGWMTIGYIANSHHVERDELVAALGLEAFKGRRIGIDRIAHEKGLDFNIFKAEIEAKIALLQKTRSKP